jgi:perosamine synthetase
VIRLTDVRIPYTAYGFVSHVLSTGHLAQGSYVHTLEKLVAAASNTVYAVAVNSGTAALQLAVETVCDPGDRVAVPGLTFAGTANAVYAAGCIPVVVDVGDDRLIDESKIPDDVHAVMPVHLYGQKAELINPSIPVIEDAAQAIGHHITHGGISLYGSKTVGCGEGGVFVTNDPSAAEYARLVRNQGMRSRYDHEMIGHNLRLTDLQAAVAVPLMTTVADTIQQRRNNADRLWSLLEDVPAVLPNPTDHFFHQFVVEVDNRDAVQDFLTSRGVETAVYYPYALSELDWLEGEAPNAERLARRVLALPVHEHLTADEVAYVAEQFRQALCVSV